MSLRFTIKKLLRKVGYDIVKFDYSFSPIARRMQLLKHYGIDLVFDVGAHGGRYALDLRRNGYEGRIVSFEPLSTAYAELNAYANADGRWQAVNIALGDENTTSQIHISAYPESSSLLPMMPKHEEVAPWAGYTGTEDVTVQTLDTVFPDHVTHGDKTFLKIDAQGYEHRILQGAQQCLSGIKGIQLEMSLVPLYEGEMLFRSLIEQLEKDGFALMSIEAGLTDPMSGQLLQVDGLFFRDMP